MKRIFSLILLCLIAPLSAANPVQDEYIEVELLAEVDVVKPGEPFWLALRLSPIEEWHVYWRNPGDSGNAPTAAWTVPAGTQVGEFQWPRPERIPVAHLVNYGYEEVFLLAEVQTPADLQGNFTVTADASWLVCKEICIPGEATLALELPLGDAAALNPTNHQKFEATRAQWPTKAHHWQAGFVVQDGQVTVQAQADKVDFNKAEAIYFFPREMEVIEYNAPQSAYPAGNTLQIQVAQNAYFTNAPDTLHGLITFRENNTWQAYEISAQPGQIMALPEALPKTVLTDAAPVEQYSLGLMLLFALLGGVILNLMPCVFPVLCLKILGLTQSGTLDHTAQRMHGLAYTVGVLMAFAAIAGVLIALRAGGAAIGWGFQLQSPWVIAILAYLLFVMGLSLSGMVTFGAQIMGVGQHLTDRGGYQGSFFTGVLATIVATPCTAPFMATAVGFAATQSAPIAMTVFLALGFGLALPFLLLAWLPGWTRFLPKPGAWMETLKQFMAFPLYATVVWLLWVLGRQTSIDGLAVVLSGLILLAFALWAWQQKSQLLRIGLTVVATAIALGLLTSPLLSPATASQTQATASARWEPFTPARLKELRSTSEQPIFVNMTADWCITCLVNEQVALNTDQTKALFDEKNVAYLKGDWTRYDSDITTYLSEFGRSGVPIYVLYPPNGKPVVLPQILTPGIVKDALLAAGL